MVIYATWVMLSTDILHAIFLVVNINSTSLLEIQDNNNISGSAFKNQSE